METFIKPRKRVRKKKGKDDKFKTPIHNFSYVMTPNEPLTYETYSDSDECCSEEYVLVPRNLNQDFD